MAEDEDSIAHRQADRGRRIRANIRILVVWCTCQAIESKCEQVSLQQELEELVVIFTDALLRHRYLPYVRLCEVILESLLQKALERVHVVVFFHPRQHLLQDSHNVRIVASLRCQGVDKRRDVNFACSEHFLVDVVWNVGSSLLQELNVCLVAELCDDL